MNRLTKVESSSVLIKDGWKKKDTESYTSICYGCEEIGRCVNKCGFYKALEKLADYEDTGLEPEEIRGFANLEMTHNQIEELIKIVKNPAFEDDSDMLLEAVENSIKDLYEYEDLKEQLLDKYNELKNKIDGDGVENYTNGYKYGHRNGQIELLEWILKIDTGYREEAEKVLEVENE